MSNLREIAGHSITSSNLGMADWSERDIDRVAALGAAGLVSPHGVDVFRWAYANDAYAAVRVRVWLEYRIKRDHGTSLHVAVLVATQAMREFNEPQCKVCDGRGSVRLVDLTVIECEGCAASGLRRYSDAERLESCGMGRTSEGRQPFEKIREPLEMAIQLLMNEDRLVNSLLVNQLERRVNLP